MPHYWPLLTTKPLASPWSLIPRLSTAPHILFARLPPMSFSRTGRLNSLRHALVLRDLTALGIAQEAAPAAPASGGDENGPYGTTGPCRLKTDFASDWFAVGTHTCRRYVSLYRSNGMMLPFGVMIRPPDFSNIICAPVSQICDTESRAQVISATEHLILNSCPFW